jgi:adenylate cyclase
MSTSRQLAAIMFTDIVGYTAMMQEDEVLAIQCRFRLKQKLEEEIKKNNGRILEFRGDGAMCSFTSTIECVRAALAIQLEMQTNPIVPLRIGMHTGDVIFEGNNIYGDGVNIASRMESFAIPGSIFISAKVYDDIKNQKDIQTVSLGKYALKNVKEQVEIFAISNQGIIVPGNNSLEGKGEKAAEIKNVEKSIAVLPFTNMSSDPEQDYFGDGIAEEILNSLAHLPGLKVSGRTSSFQFKGKNIDLRELGDKLGVTTVLEGSVRKQGNRLRITAQLINVRDGFHLWSEKYDRDMDDIFAVQDEIALAITEKLKITLLEKDRKLITKTYTQNSEAYELYLKGRFNMSRRGQHILTAMQCFQEAIDIDPDFAPAYAGYADTCCLAAFYNFYSAKEIMPKAKEAADTAIRLDVSICEPYTSLGFYYGFYEWNFTESKKNFCKAIELNPRYTIGHYWYGMLYLSWIARDFDESKKEGWAAIKLEPFSAIAHAMQTVIYYASCDYEEAVRIGKIGIDLDANSYLVYKMTALAYIGMNRIHDAIDMIQQTLKASNRFQWSMYDLMWAYYHLGDKAAMPK